MKGTLRGDNVGPHAIYRRWSMTGGCIGVTVCEEGRGAQ